MWLPFECSSCKNTLTYFLIRSEGSSNNRQISTISPLNFNISFKIKCVMTIKACCLTKSFSSCSSLNMSWTRSFIWFGNRLNKSAHVMMILAFKPNSAWELQIPKSRFKFYWHTSEEMHEILQRASTADLSSMQRVGERKAASLAWYLSKASLTKCTIIGKNLPTNPS